MSDELARVLEQLTREYVAESPARLQELRKDIAALRAGETDATKSLVMRFHRLAGSGGSYGFPEISNIARDAENWLKQNSLPRLEEIERLDYAVDQLADCFNKAGSRISGEQTTPVPASDFGWNALLIGQESVLGGQVADILRTSGYRVNQRSEMTDGEVPTSETPDLVVILGEQMKPDPYAIAAALSGRRALRPRSIVLVDPTGASDRLRAVAAGIDTVFSADRVLSDLSTYAKTLARIGTPPSSVLLVMENPDEAESTASTLAQANILVSRCDPMQAREVLARELPDLLLLDAHLPDLDGFTLAKLVRQDPRFALLPIVFLASERTLNDQVEALRAGADHFLTKPVEPILLLQLVINRAERGRRIREMVHRDGLTGLLNHATLMAELEHAVEYARRHGEPFAFLMVDVDHFKRVNDTHGHLAGDQVLLNLARVFQATVRASDIIGRYGGEEIGIILRRCNRDGAVLLAGKLRDALHEHPAVTRDGKTIPVKVSIGISACPEDGMSANVVVGAADRALYKAKSSGRDRIETS
jgi:diguanylate cyclase (GGDEF)-like protein